MKLVIRVACYWLDKIPDFLLFLNNEFPQHSGFGRWMALQNESEILRW
jgi:hypothetical protein